MNNKKVKIILVVLIVVVAISLLAGSFIMSLVGLPSNDM